MPSGIDADTQQQKTDLSALNNTKVKKQILTTQKSKSKYSQGQFGNAVAFKIIAVSCAVEIISCEENQFSVW